MNIKKKVLIYDFLYSAGAQGITVLINFVTSAILARLLSVEDFGIYQFLMVWIATSSIVGLPGFNVVVSKGILKNYDPIYQVSITHAILLTSVMVGITSVTVAVLYWFNHISHESVLLVVLITLSMPVNAFQNYESALTGKREFRLARRIQLITALLTLFLVGGVAYFSADPKFSCLAFLFSKAITTWIGHRIVQCKIVAMDRDLIIERDLIGQGLRQMGLALFFSFASRADRLLLGGLDPKMLAAFHIATLIPLQIKNNGKMMLAVFISAMGRLSGKENALILKKYTWALLLFGLFCFLFMWISLPTLIVIFFGDKYIDVGNVGVIFSLVLVTCFWINMVGMENQYQLDGMFSLKAQIARYLLFCVLIWFTHRLGLYWVALSHVISDAFYAFATFFYLKYRTR